MMEKDRILLDDIQQIMVVPYANRTSKWYTYMEIYERQYTITPRYSRLLFILNEIGRKVYKQRIRRLIG